MRSVYGAAAAIVLIASSALAQGDTGAVGPASALRVGETFTVQSKALGEVRRVNVYLPPAYTVSLAGLFVVETVLVEPDLFDTYIAFDPSLWWNDHELVNSASTRLRAGGSRRRTLYLASSAEDRSSLTARLAELLGRNAPPTLTWHYEPMPNETHATIYHPAALLALRRLFKPVAGSPQ